MDLHTVQRAGYAEVFLTARGDEQLTSAELFSEVAEALSKQQVQAIQERIYGTRAARDRLLSERRNAFSDKGLEPSSPLTYIESEALQNNDLFGLQIWGARAEGAEAFAVTPAVTVDEVAGRCFSGPYFRMLYLPFVAGGSGDHCTAQAERMFANAGAALRANGFCYTQVVRAWIYARRLLDWYGELNRIRTAHFAAEGIGPQRGGACFPASTGIQGRSLDAECFMSLLAIEVGQSAAIRVEMIAGTSRQPSAFSYGSSFSRGVSLTAPGGKTVHVSGTASINPKGESVYIGNAEAQCLETLLNVAALLEEQGGSLRSIRSATVFCKNRATLDAYQRVCKLLCLPRCPAVFVRADICRPELLLEIEAVATI